MGKLLRGPLSSKSRFSLEEGDVYDAWHYVIKKWTLLYHLHADVHTHQYLLQIQAFAPRYMHVAAEAWLGLVSGCGVECAISKHAEHVQHLAYANSIYSHSNLRWAVDRIILHNVQCQQEINGNLLEEGTTRWGRAGGQAKTFRLIGFSPRSSLSVYVYYVTSHQLYLLRHIKLNMSCSSSCMLMAHYQQPHTPPSFTVGVSSRVFS